MKKTIITVAFLILSYFNVNSQTYIESIDTLEKSKTEIYNATKLFIVDAYRQANSVIQLDDKDNGIIILKAKTQQIFGKGLSHYELWYDYTIKFQFKDNKVKFTIENVIPDCTGTMKMFANKDLSIHDVYPGMKNSGLFEKDWNMLMNGLKAEFKSVQDLYLQKMKEKPNGAW